VSRGVLINLASACALLGDAPRAAELYALLAPSAGQLFAPLAACLGAVDGYLGQLAATMGRWEEAERHFQVALEMNRRMHQWPQLAVAEVDYARMLIARGAPDDRGRIDQRLTGAWALVDRLGMGDLLAVVQVAPPNEQVPVESSSNVCLFHREGEFWSVAYRGRVARLRHRKGFEYLAELLRAPEREFAALDLALGNGKAGSNGGADGVAGSIAFGDSGPALDRTARDQFRRRRVELNAALVEAEENNDTLRASRLREEATLLAEQLASAIGLGGRSRRSRSAAE